MSATITREQALQLLERYDNAKFNVWWSGEKFQPELDWRRARAVPGIAGLLSDLRAMHARETGRLH